MPVQTVNIQGAGTDTPDTTPTSFVSIQCDSNGVLYAKLVAGNAGLLAGVVPQFDNANPNSAIAAAAIGYAFDGAFFDRVRGASVFKTVAATASGNTAVWTPTNGTKFRLMGWRMSVAGTLAAAGTQVIQLRDGASTVIARSGANVSNALPAGDSQIGEDYGSFGQLSAAANNVLNINLGTAMATGAVYIDVWGTEE